MRGFLRNHAGQEQDLTKLVSRTVSQALIPLAVDGLDDAGNRALIAEQEVRFRIQLEQRDPLWRILPNFYRSRVMTRTITRQLKHRVRAGRLRDDFAQALMSLFDRIGLDRVTYLTSVQLIAISGGPGMIGACMVYGMHRYPEWRERIREKMDALDQDELYTQPTKKLPCTLRFIREAMRLWTTPFVTRRVA
ncbi:MAG: cytochrome, partial [Dokdonella sp.]